MCLVHSKAAADDGLEQLRRTGEGHWEEKIALLASEDTVERGDGISQLFQAMKYMPPELRHVRKFRIGHHRAYFTGQHTNCQYDLHWIKCNKKSDVDREGDKAFQRRLLSALSMPRTRVIPSPGSDESGASPAQGDSQEGRP